jgi:GT2 family glycosyltransferase
MDEARIAISAIVPACQRVRELRETLHRIQSCRPAPAEILVHADGSDSSVLDMVRLEFPTVRLVSSDCLLGPGGSRDRLVREAFHNWIANFDDDSYPLDADYFEAVRQAVEASPDCAVFSAITLHDQDVDPSSTCTVKRSEIPVFSGCGCIYNKTWYERTRGYVPVPVAYGMEEVDLSLQLHALGAVILETPQLRVYHKDPYATPPSDNVLAYSIANIALLGYLRYPVILWPLVPLQLLSRIVWAVRRGWTAGLRQAFCIIPRHLRRYTSYRMPLPALSVLSWLAKRHSPSTST